MKLSVTQPCRALALGDSWISPLDYTDTWGEYLKALSLLDGEEFHQVQAVADAAKVGLKSLFPGTKSS